MHFETRQGGGSTLDKCTQKNSACLGDSESRAQLKHLLGTLWTLSVPGTLKYIYIYIVLINVDYKIYEGGISIPQYSISKGIVEDLKIRAQAHDSTLIQFQGMRPPLSFSAAKQLLLKAQHTRAKGWLVGLKLNECSCSGLGKTGTGRQSTPKLPLPSRMLHVTNLVGRAGKGEDAAAPQRSQ